jgi:xylan 1,4-beta-xylosidase
LGIVRSFQGNWEEFPESEISIGGTQRCKLKANINNNLVLFSYALDDGEWNTIGKVMDISHLSDEAGGKNGFIRFTGNFLGLCVQDLSGMKKYADFAYFRCEAFED